jgi:hypothetical protein
MFKRKGDDLESVKEYKLRLRLLRKHVDAATFAFILEAQGKELKKITSLLERLIVVMEKEHGIRPKTK